MSQYCRYCAYLCVGDAAWCSEKEKVISDEAAKRTNRCKHFAFNPIDAFGETDGYKPRPRKEGKAVQVKLFELPKTKRKKEV